MPDFPRRSHVSVWKILSAVAGLCFFVGLTWFVAQTYRYYQAIKSGKTNPLLEQRLQSTVSHLVANAQVTPADLARLNVPDAPTFGATNTKLTVVEFLDFDCPYCEASFAPVRELIEQYKTQLQFVVRDFPIEELHPRALPSALAARCAQAQGKFWPYHDKLFSNQDHHEDADLLQYGREIGLDEKMFGDCYHAQTFRSKIERDVSDGLQAGVQGTPTFFFNGVKIQGAPDHQTLEFLIQAFLKQSANGTEQHS